MKKISGLLVIALVLVIAGCNKDKKDTNDLVGTWHVYKYLYQNADETSQFLQANPLYNYTFAANGTYVLRNGGTVHDTTVNGVLIPDTLYGSTTTGKWAFANNYTHLILTDSVLVFQDSVLISTTAQKNYTIFDLSGSNVQLDSANTSEYYLIKNM